MTRRALPFALVLLAAAPALGFVLSANAIARKTAGHRDDLQLTSLVVKGTFYFEGEAAKAAASALKQEPLDRVQLPATISYKLPGRCRVELDTGSTDNPVAVNVNGKVKTSGPAVPLLEEVAQLGCPMLYQRGSSADGYLAFLKDTGVDTGTVTLGRTAGTVAYVVGGKAKGDKPTFWVDKDRFQPVKFATKANGAALEVRFVDFGSPVAGEWHPRVVEVVKGDALAGKFVTEKADANVKLADTQFQP